MWSLLGARQVEMLAWESFGAGWVTDAVKQLNLDANVRTAEYGEIVDLGRRRLGRRRGLHLERHDLRRARALRATRFPADRERPDHLRRHLRGLRAATCRGTSSM